MQYRTIPAGIRAWIAMQNGTKWITGFHRHTCGLGITATLPPPPPDPSAPKNVQVITWGIGKLLIYLNATTDPAIYPVLELEGIGPFHTLWPLTSDSIVWPPIFFVGDAYIDDLSNALEGFITSGSVILTDNVPNV